MDEVVVVDVFMGANVAGNDGVDAMLMWICMVMGLWMCMWVWMFV